MSELEELAARIEKFNEWRRGGDFDMPSSVLHGNDLDDAVKAIRVLSKSNDSTEQLNSLFERVSGCSISEFDSEQVKYLADMIEGQMDADELIIDELKVRIKKLEG